MNKTKIEWVKNPDGSQGYTWNPITGCLNGCEYCYATKLANGRLKSRYLANKNTAPTMGNVLLPNLGFVEMNPFYPRFWPERCHGDLYTENYPKHGKPKGIFVCDMSDLFGAGIPKKWTAEVMTEIELYPWHRFYLLTKQPQNLSKFSPFPPNCYVGVTATNPQMFYEAQEYLEKVVATVRYISLEPYLEKIWTPQINAGVLDWLIIGACTGRMVEIAWLCGKYPDLTPMPYGKIWTAQPPIEWLEEIVQACDKAGIPVFLKDNLKPLILSHAQDKNAYWAERVLDKGGLLRQEVPK